MAFNPDSLQRARALMNPDMQQKMDGYKGQGVSSMNFEGPSETYMTEGQLYEAGYDLSQIKGMPQGPRSIKESALPDVIKRSFMEQEINVDCLNPDYQREKQFEAAMNAMLNEAEQTTPQYRNVVNENVYPTNNSGIDYNLLRQIVEESIDRKLKNLNENVIKGIRLKEGKIMLTDHSGNVFSASLEYKGNVNEQKTKKKG